MKQSLDLLVLDRSEQLVAVLSDEGTACPYFNSQWLVQINGVLSLQFDVPQNHPSAAFLEQDGAIVLFRFDWEPADSYHEYHVIETEVIHDDNLLMTVYCEHARNELLDGLIADKRPTNNTAAQALTTALEGTRWQVGTVGDFGLNSTTFYYINPLDAVVKITNTWGGEVWYRTVITGNKITGRYVDILTRLGSDTGKRFEYEKDTATIKRTKIRTNIKTAIYGRGQGVQSASGDTYTRRLTIADIEWKVVNGDPVDKPIGQEWVGDPIARDTYGYPDGTGKYIHRFGTMVDDQQTSAAALLKESWDYLQTVNKPLVQYDFTIIDTYSITGGDRSWEKVDIGDMTVCIDDDMGAQLDARVIEIKRDLGDLTIADVKIGNFMPHDFYSNTEQTVSQVKKALTDTSPTWSSIPTQAPVTDTAIPDVIPDIPASVVATGAFATIMVEWDYVSTISIASYEVYGSEIQGFVPDSTNLLWRGKSGVFIHTIGSNKQWYYRVRAVNTHGNPGALSAEVTASTVRLQTDDMMFGSVTAAVLADLSVGAAKLADGAVVTSKIADLAINAAKLADGTITGAKVLDGAISEGKLADLSITAAKLANSAVTVDKIADLSITPVKIQNAAVTSDKIDNAAVTTAKLALASVTSDRIAVGAISDTHIDTGAITAAKMNWATHLIF